MWPGYICISFKQSSCTTACVYMGHLGFSCGVKLKVVCFSCDGDVKVCEGLSAVVKAADQ